MPSDRTKDWLWIGVIAASEVLIPLALLAAIFGLAALLAVLVGG